MYTDVDAWDNTRELYEHCKWLDVNWKLTWEKNPLLHLEIEPASVLHLAFYLDTLPTELGSNHSCSLTDSNTAIPFPDSNTAIIFPDWQQHCYHIPWLTATPFPDSNTAIIFPAWQQHCYHIPWLTATLQSYSLTDSNTAIPFPDSNTAIIFPDWQQHCYHIPWLTATLQYPFLTDSNTAIIFPDWQQHCCHIPWLTATLFPDWQQHCNPVPWLTATLQPCSLTDIHCIQGRWHQTNCVFACILVSRLAKRVCCLSEFWFHDRETNYTQYKHILLSNKPCPSWVCFGFLTETDSILHKCVLLFW